MPEYKNVLFRVCKYIAYRYKAVSAHGLHSPFLFDFYNEVIAPKKEFYFFKRFRAILNSISSQLSEKNLFFLYRWIAFYKPKTVGLLYTDFTVALALSEPCVDKRLSVYSKAGYSEDELTIFNELGIVLSEGHDAELIYLHEINDETIKIVSKSQCVIIQKPHHSKEKEQIWNDICSSNEVSISIDLFQFGILLMDKNQAKQHFIVKMN